MALPVTLGDPVSTDANELLTVGSRTPLLPIDVDSAVVIFIAQSR
jgi:hypothetical protein